MNTLKTTIKRIQRRELISKVLALVLIGSALTIVAFFLWIIYSLAIIAFS